MHVQGILSFGNTELDVDMKLPPLSGWAKAFFAAGICFVPFVFIILSYQRGRVMLKPPKFANHNAEKHLSNSVTDMDQTYTGVVPTSYTRLPAIAIVSGQRVRSVDWENLIRNDPPLTDWSTASTPDKSVLSFAVKQDTYRVGDEVIVDITVRDFLGRRKTKGGDIVRVVARDAQNGAASIGYVLDHNDGMYTGVIKMLWAGTVTIEARVGSTREMIQTMHRLIHSGYIKHRIFGQLEHEILKCTPVLNVAKRYNAFCNLTNHNTDLPWFCERPKNGSCDPKLFSHFFWNTNPINITKQEKMMNERINTRTVPKTLIVPVEKDSNGAAVAWSQTESGGVPCNQFPPRDLWKLNSPIGSVYNNVWHPLHCRMTFKQTPQNFEKCLRGRKVWFIGDSNARAMFTYIFNVLKMHLLTESWSNPKWHKLSVAVNANKSVTTTFAFHAMPCYIQPSGKINGTHDYIDRIPAASSDIVVVHFYMHYMAFPPYIYRKHVQKTVDAVKALRARSPKAKVIVRACHSMYLKEEKTNFDDYWAIVYNRILKEEFTAVADYVYYLDTWDVSEALGNTLIHPPHPIFHKIMMYFMSLICS